MVAVEIPANSLLPFGVPLVPNDKKTIKFVLTLGFLNLKLSGVKVHLWAIAATASRSLPHASPIKSRTSRIGNAVWRKVLPAVDGCERRSL
jgi:hypothetical protein